MVTNGRLNRIAIFALTLMLIVCFGMPVATLAKDKDKKVVRVGWHEPPHYITDEYGRKSGYSYEYTLKVAAYTGWEIEYVDGTWTDLFDMLKRGEIDVLSDVSYTDERAQEMLYTALPMGTEAYYVFVAPGNTEITPDNLSSLNGKTVGVTEGSIQKDIFEEWESAHGIKTEIVEINCDEEEGIPYIGDKYDAYVTMDTYGSPDTMVPICKIGSTDFYFAVNKDRPDILSDLDSALNKIQDENKYYDQQLHDKYLKSTEPNRYLSNDEQKWLEEHGTIRVGYLDNYLAFCAKDPVTGELMGALRDYLEFAQTVFENAEIKFEPVAFSNASEAIEALRNGSIDCMFPANLTSYDAEQLGLVMTPSLISTEMVAVVRESAKKKLINKENIVVAVNEGNTNYDKFLEENFPKWKRLYFKDTPTGIDAVANGTVDCVVLSSYRYGNISKQCESNHLTTVYTGVDIDFCFAMKMGETDLYSILSKMTAAVPDSIIHSSLTYYSTEDVKTSVADVIKDNLFIITTVIALVLLVILILLLRGIRAERKVFEEERIVSDLNKRVFMDSLTSVRNKGAYTDFMEKLQDQIDKGVRVEFAVGVFDCNDLKKVNDIFGHDKGDIYIKNACNLICKVFEHSPVFRVGGDEFSVIFQNDDLNHIEELSALFESRRSKINAAAKNKWDEVHVAFGIATYDRESDDTVHETARRADKIMYENKRIIKERNAYKAE